MYKYKYGTFSEDQISSHISFMHSSVHKLLLYKDSKVEDVIFANESEFNKFFINTLFRFGGLNELFDCPNCMVALMETLQSAYTESLKPDFDFSKFRRLIFDAQNYISQLPTEVR